MLHILRIERILVFPVPFGLVERLVGPGIELVEGRLACAGFDDADAHADGVIVRRADPRAG